MAEFTIQIDTKSGIACTEDQLDVIADTLGSGEALDAVVSIETETGVVGATFQVEAASIEDAGPAGVNAFKVALRAAGLVVSSGRYRVQPLDEDEVDHYSVARATDDHRGRELVA